jgi:hypothetical protein
MPEKLLTNFDNETACLIMCQENAICSLAVVVSNERTSICYLYKHAALGFIKEAAASEGSSSTRLFQKRDEQGFINFFF